MVRPHIGKIPELGRWGTPRPLPPEVARYIHGAVDFVADTDDVVVAPEPGLAYAFVVIRPAGRMEPWGWQLKDVGPQFVVLPWAGYVEDIYGSVVLLEGASGKVHLFAHAFFKQVFISLKSRFGMRFDYQEEPATVPHPMRIFHTFNYPQFIGEGAPLCRVGNMGTSRGAHVHWEMHNGWEFTPAAERPNPEDYLG